MSRHSFAALPEGTADATNPGDLMDVMHDTKSEPDFMSGRGNWKAFDLPLDRIFSAAARWRELIGPVDKPWLCWNVEPDWCVLQQRLVAAVGWTPVVGFDPRVGPPPLIAGAVLVDFNAGFGFPNLYPHFPLEFAFLFAPRLAFWHSDFLLDLERMEQFAARFAGLADGEMTAVAPIPAGFINRLPWRRRYWELLGCTTSGASRSQFENGRGWWMHYYNHPNFKGKVWSRSRRWDHGFGIKAWELDCGGVVHRIAGETIKDGHFTRIGKKQNYKATAANNVFRNLHADLRANFDLSQCAEKMRISHLLRG